MRLVQVAVPVPQLDALTYSVPDDLPDPVIGARVLVPLGKRVLTGIVVSESEQRLAVGGWRSAIEPESAQRSDPEPSGQAPGARRQGVESKAGRQPKK